MRLGIRLDERYEPVTGVMYDTPNAFLASILAMPVIVLEDDYRLFPALTRMFDIASMKVAIVAVEPANWADSILLSQQLYPKGLSFARVHQRPTFSSPRSQLTSTPKTKASALSS